MFTRLSKLTGIGLLLLIYSGCSRAPSIDVAGSFLPSWMLCLIVAVIITAVLRWQLVRRRLENRIMPIGVFYPSVVVAIACLLWLLIFR